jgi:hypothetical protein
MLDTQYKDILFMKIIPKFHLIASFIFLIIGWVVLPVQPAAAWTQVTLAWSPNTEPDLAGYRTFSRLEGEGYAYDAPAWEGTETTCTLDIWEENSRYCFVVRAFDTEGYESVDSDEVCYEGIGSSNPPPDDPAPDDPLPDDPAAKSATDDATVYENDMSYGCFIQSLLK